MKLTIPLLLFLFFKTVIAGELPETAEASVVLGIWDVEVQGESRHRELVIYRRNSSTNNHSIDAIYGWFGSDLSKVDAEFFKKDEKYRITITTPALSKIDAELIENNTFRGLFQSKAGETKTIQLTRKINYLDITHSFAGESIDFGVSPTQELSNTYHKKTPLVIPGAKTIKTLELWQMLESLKKPIIIDVLEGTSGKKVGIPSAIWLGASAGIATTENNGFIKALNNITLSDRQKPVVFYCLNAECWLSYNAALKALSAGFTNIYWYRGGIDSWKSAKLPLNKLEKFDWE